MIVPDHWAEAVRQHRSKGRQVTVRRFGWSETSEADAVGMAEQRADEALRRIVQGEKLATREPKVAYNGASGVPIREEVLARHGEEVITRNAYGARCLNSPRALFADVDFEPGETLAGILWTFGVLACASVLAGVLNRSWGMALSFIVLSAIFATSVRSLAGQVLVRLQGGYEKLARRRIARFVSAHASWNLRLYRTPAGYRVLVTHRPFDATEQEVQDFFKAIASDPVYVRMCVNQRCFRARLTAKPWRVGLDSHIRPRPGVWPVRAEHMEKRRQWIASYEARAASAAACHFVEALGSGVIDPEIRRVMDLHDRLSGALESRRPLA